MLPKMEARMGTGSLNDPAWDDTKTPPELDHTTEFITAIKCTRSDGTDYRTGRNRHFPGAFIVEPNTDPSDAECSDGLHWSPTARQTCAYISREKRGPRARFFEILVPVSDLRALGPDKGRELTENGCVYLCRKKDLAHLVYKLCKVAESEPAQWFWSALWNSSAICGKQIGTSHKWKHLFDSLESAINAMLDQPDWLVWRAHFDGTLFKP